MSLTPDQYAEAKRIFLAACQKPAQQRPAFIDEACGDKAEVRAEVEKLMAYHVTGTVSDAADALGDVRTMAMPPPGTESPGDRPDDTDVLGRAESSRGAIASFRNSARGAWARFDRADDLTLEQPVALKFLTSKVAQSPVYLDRLLQEVKVAREVTHPNVCRVYDIGEAAGMHFISMQYVDGENLAQLLKRIGRLPTDKALEIARQLCIGLAAAHTRGVLHRDLKPANIMLDGRGQVCITDFGLAGSPDQIKGREIRAGTPAYMAPEQIAGLEVSVRSDIYSLGLVLYELFCGKAAFRADSIEEYQRLHEKTSPTLPSLIVEDLNSAIERVSCGAWRRIPPIAPSRRWRWRRHCRGETSSRPRCRQGRRCPLTRSPRPAVAPGCTALRRGVPGRDRGRCSCVDRSWNTRPAWTSECR